MLALSLNTDMSYHDSVAAEMTSKQLTLMELGELDSGHGRLPLTSKSSLPLNTCSIDCCDEKHKAKGLCKKHYVAKWRNENKEIYKIHRIKANKKYRENPENKIKKYVHKLVENAINSGMMERLPCEVCDDEKSHAHHEDYNRPFDIIWLCDQHHKEVHK